MKLFGLEINSSKRFEGIREDLADLQRQLEDLGWTKINGSAWSTQSAIREQYQDMVKRCRLAFIKSPIVAQAINITTYYTFGEGVTAPRCYQDEEVGQIINDFWNDPDNRLSFTSSANQMRLSNKLQYDGELAIALQVDKDGSVYVRIIDPLSITEIITDSQDHMRQLFYKRRIGTSDQYISDWSNGVALIRDQEPERWIAMLKQYNIQPKQVLENVYLFHVKQNNDILDARGIPDVYRALDWVNSNTKINSDTATFINAQAQFAWKKKVKGSRAQIDNMAARQRQNTSLTNPSYQAGSTHVSNEGVDLEAVGLPSSSGQLFETGIRRSLLMVCAAFGIMEHYFGDPSTGNLATSKSMELPMLKKFLARQKFWESIYADVFDFVLNMKLLAVNTKSFSYNEMKNRISILENRDYSSRLIDIDFPPILDEDLKNLADALVSAKNAQLCPIETAQRTFLQGLGVNNIEEELLKEFSLSDGSPILNGNQDKNNGGAPATKEKRVREAVEIPGSLKGARSHALKLSEKNKTVLAKLNGYRKTISNAYSTFVEESRGDMAIHKTGGENFEIAIPNSDHLVKKFSNRMLEAARMYYPQVVSIAEKYVAGKTIKTKESKILESKKMDKFLEDQLKWNSDYVETSLAPAIKAKIKAMESNSYLREKDALDDFEEYVGAMEARVAKYIGALWTVDQRAVKEAAKGSGQTVNFVGVDDKDTCEGCSEALSGNPYPIESSPVPGEQDCQGNCRHALQLIDDEPLTESDIQILRDAEAEAKKGFKLLS